MIPEVRKYNSKVNDNFEWHLIGTSDKEHKLSKLSVVQATNVHF